MEDHIVAHKFSSNNCDSIRASKLCGCFYCLMVFPPKEITDWLDDKTETAVCPYCGVDSVVGDSACYPLTLEFLERMKSYWF